MPPGPIDKNIALCATLSAIAYEGVTQDEASRLIAKALNQEDLPTHQEWHLVWGPIIHESDLMYIVQGPDGAMGKRFALVIRGTVKSIKSTLQDLELVLEDLPWFSNTAPKEAKISFGIVKAFKRLTAMRMGEVSALEFLKKQDGSNELLVTGHSLGGCLASVMPLYMQDQLTEWKVQPYTFAGQSAGNQAFANYFEATFPQHIRFHNSLDIIPRLWNYDSLRSIKELYPADGPKCDLIFKGIIDIALGTAARNFFQPDNGTSLTGQLYDEYGFFTFEKEAGAQHNHLYYMYLTGVPLSAIQGSSEDPGMGPGWMPPRSIELPVSTSTTTDSIKEEHTSILGINTNLSYFTLRKIIGWSGMLLPWLVWLIAWKYEPSISDYYYTRAGVLFTSVLTLCGSFLISYRGYEREGEKISDNLITWIGGILIIIVAAVPTPYLYNCPCPTPICHTSDAWGTVHFGSAALFFVAMGYLSLVRFRRGKGEFSPDKIVRNKIYKFCGISMWIVLGAAGVSIFMFHLDDMIDHLVLWVEVVLLMLFGISWLVKGKGLVDLGIQKDDD